LRGKRKSKFDIKKKFIGYNVTNINDLLSLGFSFALFLFYTEYFKI